MAALADYLPDWMRSREERTEQRVEQYQQIVERAQNSVRKAGGDPDAFAQAMETAAVKATGGTPLRSSVMPSDTLSDWEIAGRLASSRLNPREVEKLVKEVATTSSAPAKDAVSADKLKAWTDDNRRFAEGYIERTIAAAPPPTPAELQQQRQAPRRAMRAR